MSFSSQAICTQQNVARRHFSFNECSSRTSCSLQVFREQFVMRALEKTRERERATWEHERVTREQERVTREHKRATWEHCHECYVQ